MAKKIPVKKKQVKAKAKSKKPNFTKVLAELDSESKERMEWVETIMTPNDANFIDTVLTPMVENLRKMQGPPRLIINGEPVTAQLNKDEWDLLVEIQDRSFHWIATRCIVACAEWGIKIGNFKAPKSLCIRCGVKVKSKPKKKGKK